MTGIAVAEGQEQAKIGAGREERQKTREGRKNATGGRGGKARNGLAQRKEVGEGNEKKQKRGKVQAQNG